MVGGRVQISVNSGLGVVVGRETISKLESISSVGSLLVVVVTVGLKGMSVVKMLGASLVWVVVVVVEVRITTSSSSS